MILLLSPGMVATYFVLLFFYPLFFQQPLRQVGVRSLRSVALILVVFAAAWIVSSSLPDLSWGNRILHIFGGGFLAFLICFLGVRDSKVRIHRFQFIIISILIVETLGVGNELLEFVLQDVFHFTLATSINDTWLDLASNTVGALLGAAIFMPFMKNQRVD
jgi:hypothetical protein